MLNEQWLRLLGVRQFAEAAPAAAASGRRVHWVLGLFPTGDLAGDGVEALAQAGFSKKDISVMSATPLPPNAFGLDDAKGKLWTPWWTLAGALSGACLGFLIAGGTAWLYPLNTAGKAILSFPPIGVITYEFTMLLATLFTVVATMYNMYLPAYGKQPYAVEVTEGYFAVVIPCRSDDDAKKAEGAFKGASATDVRRDPWVEL